MPKIIPPRTRSRFDQLIRAGHHIDEAARRAGVSYSWAKKRNKELQARGQATPRDSVAPKVLALHQQGRSASEVAEMTGLPKAKVENFVKRGAGEGWQEPDEDNKVGPIALADLSDVARDCLDDFERFRARYLGSVSTPWQVEAAVRLVEMLASPDKSYAVFNMPQGGGKTRLMHDVAAWLTVRDRSIRGIFGSLAQTVSAGCCSNLRDTLERVVPAEGREIDVARGLATKAQATLAADYGYFKPPTSGGLWRRESFVVAQHGGASVEKEPTWAAFSREAKFLGWRVDCMIWDDLVNTDMLRNQDRVEDLYQWWNDEAESRLDPGGLCLLVGQRLRSNDIYRFCLDKNVQVDEFDDSPEAETRPQYTHIVYKAHYDDRCQGQHRIDAPSYPEGCLLDPARIKWRDVKEKQAAGNYEVVYQQEDVDPSSVLVQKPWVNGGIDDQGVRHDGCWDEDRVIGQLPVFPPGSHILRYMTIDPSPTKFWALMDWVYVLLPDSEPLAGYRYLIDIERTKMRANDLIDWSLHKHEFHGLAEEWVQASKKTPLPIKTFIMEKNAAQRWAMQYDFFQVWWQTRGITVLPHETTNNKTDKDYGVDATLPAAYRYGRVRLPGGDKASRLKCWPLVREVTTYPNSRTTDCVMSQWFGEYQLQNMVLAFKHKSGSIYNDMPSWLKKKSARGLAGALG